jgi:PPOX class probable F420-dependent enzyme
VDPQALRELASAARVGRLATAGSDGTPHVVPVCFVLLGDVAYSAVDHKPKRGRRLRRVVNIEATGRACLLLDEYDEDWTRLWWVRLDARARIVREPTESAVAVSALTRKYTQYAERPPGGPVLALDVERWTSWSGG